MNEKSEIKYYLNKFDLNNILDSSIKDLLKIYRFLPGQHIVLNDEPLEIFYFFVEGKAKVYSLLENGKSLLVRFYNPLEIIGEVELFSTERNICNVQAISDVCCLGIKSEIIKKSYNNNPDLLLYFCRSLSRKLISFNISSSINLMYPLENRLASYLVAISSIDNDIKKFADEIHTDNKTELADLLGTSYRHLTRTIKQFSIEGIIKISNKDYEILNWKKLNALARGIYT